MLQAKIYIATDSRSTKITKKGYGYVLETIVEGTERTKEGFGSVAGTYHQAVLTALAEALRRFVRPCEICICSEDEFVLNMLENNLAVWAGNEFLTAKRKPVANREEWEDIWKWSDGHLILTQPGKHKYTDWIRNEIRRER